MTLDGGVVSGESDDVYATCRPSQRLHATTNSNPPVLPPMSRWPIDRNWRLRSDTGSEQELRTRDLVGRRVCCLLGPAGIGKTYELAYLEELERLAGYAVRRVRLAELASSADRLTSSLDELTSGASERSAVYLDAVDEAMIPVATTSLILASWIRRNCHVNRPLLRVSCRSAIWPRAVEAAIAEVYGAESVTIASLQPLSDSDVLRVASLKGIDGKSFCKHVAQSNVSMLAQQPLTLQMLLRLFKAHGGLPAGRRELFSRAVDLLSHEREERREVGTATDIAPAIILEAAERLACFSILSGRETVDLSDDPSTSSLGWLELASLPSAGRPLDERLLKAIGCSGLCEGDGTNRFRFIHRQVAEYLTGRRLARLPFHQARALLCSRLGWQAGVAGPLQETTAFAASECVELAAWVSETDPEVIGQSDVADDDLRHRATLRLFEKFRRRELTDSQIVRDSLPLAGLQYRGAEDDLRQALRARGDTCEDLLELVVRLIESWQLSGLDEDLADLVLDPSAPLHPRVSAGYALARSGGREQRRRLKRLIAGSPEDPNDELKGLALRCNWPEDLTTREVLGALHPGSGRAFLGAYFGFLAIVDQAGFDASDDRLAGLGWTKDVLQSERTSDPTVRIGRRIAHGALCEIDDPTIAGALADLLLESARLHAGSPLAAIGRDEIFGRGEAGSPAPLEGRVEARRILLSRLAEKATEEPHLWWVVSETPGLVVLADFPWLLACACDTSRPSIARENYASLARMVPFFDDREAVEAWLRHRECEPVKTKLDYPLSTRLGSDEARQAKEQYAAYKRRLDPPARKTIEPPPHERVQIMLARAETKDIQFFFNLCQELTLTEGSNHYGFERFLSRTPGWEAADVETRGRIVDSAKRLLASPTADPEECRSIPLNKILMGYMLAVWLVMEQDSSWLEGMTDDWWNRWCWYFLRELHPRLGGEPDDPKDAIFRLLHARSAPSVRDAVAELTVNPDQDSRSLLTGLLELYESIDDPEIDGRLAGLVRDGKVGVDRVWNVARFLLARDYENAVSSCRARLALPAEDRADDLAVEVASALLYERTSGAWGLAISFLRARPDLAKRMLAKYAHAEPGPDGRQSASAGQGFTPDQVGQLLVILFEHYPPESDPKHDGAFCVTEDDSAVSLRDRLLEWMGRQKTGQALEALRALEQQFGARYPWLRRPRSTVDRAYRQTLWSPRPPLSVAPLLVDGSKRLIRSGADAVDGVVAAIEQFERNLHHASPSQIEDLWNTPRRAPATPKDEERISDKICEAVRQYYREHALAAEREVQVFRRRVPRTLGGAPGSEVDILVRISAAGTSDRDPIVIPIEVKRSGNDEARTGLRDQLVNRYMRELGASYGVFIVVWLDAPALPSGHRPVWANREDAQAELNRQASDVADETDGAVRVATIVLDASLT